VLFTEITGWEKQHMKVSLVQRHNGGDNLAATRDLPFQKNLTSRQWFIALLFLRSGFSRRQVHAHVGRTGEPKPPVTRFLKS